MAKRKSKSKASNSSFAKYLKIAFLFLFIIAIALIVFINLEDEKSKETSKTHIQKIEHKKIKKDEKTTVSAINSYDKSKLNTNFNELFQDIKTTNNCEIKNPTCMKEPEMSAFTGKKTESKIHKINSNNNISINEDLKKPSIQKASFTQNDKKKKAKLAIIIDDIATKQESDAVLRIIKSGKMLTPSFFPNTSNHPNTNKFANNFDYFMVHLPLEAINFKKNEPKTLNVGDSYEVVENRIKNIKGAFPRLKFINNHTGSAYTSDEESMRKLFKALKKYNLIFVDSRTIATTKGELMAKEFNQKYIHRNIFLDNILNIEEINKKLDEAVNFAKKHKRAIAIAHPHKVSLKAISEYDFSEIELVNIYDIYSKY